MKIYHNPRCRKSRETLQILREHGLKPEIILYLDNPPGEKELRIILHKLGIKARDLVRREESIFKSDYKGLDLTEEQWIEVLLSNPKLIQRPIVVKGDKAVIGRPPEIVLELL